jgi:hypothetical protein
MFLQAFMTRAGTTLSCILSEGGTRWRNWMRHCATSRKVAGSIPNGDTGIFIDIILPATLWPWGDSASNINEYQEYFLWGGGGKAAGA